MKTEDQIMAVSIPPVEKKTERCSVNSLRTSISHPPRVPVQRPFSLLDEHLDTCALSDLPRPRVSPFLRWAGGKRNQIKHFLPFFPRDYQDRPYFEPFAGAASMFLALQPKIALLSDANPRLIETLIAVATNVDALSSLLEQHRANHSQDYYYAQRKAFNDNADGDPLVRAGLFIYLNRTCFNGLYRVNRQDRFNVPFGNKASHHIPSREDLLECSRVLSKAKISCEDFRKALGNAKSGSLVYLDPPYPALNETAFFTHYTPERFSDELHVSLRDIMVELTQRGVLVIQSNADTPRIRELYTLFRTHELNVVRHVSCKATKLKARELLITNFTAEGKID